MSTRSESQVWEDFMTGEYAQSEIQKIKTAQAFSDGRDRDKLYNVDPKNKTELSQSTETMGVSGGGGSLVGSGDSKALYTTKSAPVPGGAEEFADATVEGLEAVQDAMLEVANKAATGKPLGTQDNNSEKWDGLQAAGKSVKQFTREAQQAPGVTLDPKKTQEFMKGFSGTKMMDSADPVLELQGDEDSELESILAELEKEGTEEKFTLASKRADAVSLLKELVKIANDLDAQGQHDDAAEIDAVIKDEVKQLAASKK